MLHLGVEFNRSEMLKVARETTIFDLAIVGGGIHGASLARLASLSGLRVLLLEQKDFAFGISSRSSKMLHGGVRYLEQGNVALVKEALAERAYQLAQAPHLCRSQSFVLPILERSARPAWQMQFGLWVYSLLGQLFRPKEVAEQAKVFEGSSRLGKDSPQWKYLAQYGCSPKALLRYIDGQMDDTRLVLENCIDAARLGACLLNYTELKSLKLDSGQWQLGCQDTLSAQAQEYRASVLINLAGPWVREVHECWKPWSNELPQPVYVRGTHLVFDFAWQSDAAIIPSDEAGRYYFIWPYSTPLGEATLVGPTSVACAQNENDCQPSEEEIEELLGYLQRDFPKHEFSSDRIQHAFAGMRILAGPAPQSGKRRLAASKLSREDYFIEDTRYLALLGGKYTTSRNTAEKLLEKVMHYFEGKRLATEIRSRPLPGGVHYCPHARQSIQALLESHFNLDREDEHLIAHIVSLFGVRARELIHFDAPEDKQPLSAFFSALIRFLIEKEALAAFESLPARLGFDDQAESRERYGAVMKEEFLAVGL